ncbi:hypothetical protein M3Y94_00031500 [Aphelenchoides besseyi]|nr:hypothetical protein M3Y94_00031500 [Aphelenchoides besseyi]KAI6218614.1 hypothetical protein M3Y95_01161400 [Aphelenchoides besseyi]
MLLHRRRKVLCGSLLVTFFLVFGFLERYNKTERRSFELSSLILVDSDCLRLLENSKNVSCRLPLEVASLKNPQRSTRHSDLDSFPLVYQLKDEESEDFLTFESLNSTHSNRLIPRSHEFRLQTVQLEGNSTVGILVPVKIFQFLRHWENGNEFQSTNSGSKLKTFSLRNVDVFAQLRELVDSHGATTMLISESLLALYLHSTVLTDDQKLHIAIRDLEFTSPLQFALGANFELRKQVGERGDSFSSSLVVERLSIELSLLYTLNETTDYLAVHHDRSFFQSMFPTIRTICALNFYGRLFWVPCNSEEILKTQFGDQLNEPMAKIFVRSDFPTTLSLEPPILLDSDFEYAEITSL